MKVFIVVSWLFCLNRSEADNILMRGAGTSSDPAHQSTAAIGPSYIDANKELKTEFEEQNDEDYPNEDKLKEETTKKPCAIVVMSNIQNPNTQSLIRKYRYDENGVLIPSSVKYFIKMPSQGLQSPVLVPLHDKAFSPMGGFVRYYKEVPPIPQHV